MAADGVLRSSYGYATSGYNSLPKLTITYGTGSGQLYINAFDGTKVEFTTGGDLKTVEVGKKNTIEFSEGYIYDGYLTFKDVDVRTYGIKYDQKNDPFTFTVGTMPDQKTASGLTVPFTLTTIDVLGTVKETSLKVSLSLQDSAVTSSEQEIDLSKDDDEWYFTVDLAKYGINSDFWVNNHDKFVVKSLFSDKSCNTAADETLGEGNTLTASLVDAKGKAASAGDATAIKVTLAVTQATYVTAYANTTYYIKIESQTTDDEVISTITVPVVFKAPTLKTILDDHAIPGFVDKTDGTLLGYFTDNSSSVNLTNLFTDLVDGSSPNDVKIGTGTALTTVAFDLDDVTKVAKNNTGTGVASNLVAKFGSSATETKLTLVTDDDYQIDPDDDAPVKVKSQSYIYSGYGKNLIVTAEATTYGETGFKYADKDGQSSFKIRLSSPIASGQAPVVTLKLSSSALGDGGVHLTASAITGIRANGETYSLFKFSSATTAEAAGKDGTAKYTADGLAGSGSSVTFGAGTYVKTDGEDATETWTDEDGVTHDGYIVYVKNDQTLGSFPQDDKIAITITDDYGYTRVFKTSVTIVK